MASVHPIHHEAVRPALDNRGLRNLGHLDGDVFVRHTSYVETERTTNMHVHDKSQLGLCRDKSLTFCAGTRVWVAPPGTAFFAPAGVAHEVRSHSGFDVQSVFLPPSFPGIPVDSGVISTNPLIQELVNYLVRAADEHSPNKSVSEAVKLLCERLQVSHSQTINLPMPKDRRLLKVANALLEDPTDRRSLEDWASSVGASARSLSRLFPIDTGMTFREWHQTLRLIEGIRRMTEGASVGTAAIEVGYENVGAFIDMFKRVTNSTPSSYMRALGD